MPLIKDNGANAPDWCTLRHFEIVEFSVGETKTFTRVGKREKIILLEGACHWGTDDTVERTHSTSGDKLALGPGEDVFVISEVIERAKILRFCGSWGPGCDTFGTFKPSGRTPPRDKGNSYDYPKTNDIDRHYHDCDEYWIIYEGRGRAISEGKFLDVAPGDCIATGMGHHHDFPIDYDPVKAVYLETDLEGQKRKGHLWEYAHGPAVPDPDRV